MLKRRLWKSSFFCEFCKFFKNIFWQNTSGWLLLAFIWRFWEEFQSIFYRVPLGNCVFHVKVAEFQPQDTIENYFTIVFQAFYTRTASSHSKTLKFLKILKIPENYLWRRCEMPACMFTKKALSNILFHVFGLHFLRMHHDYLFWRGLKVREHNFFQRKVVLLIYYLFDHDSSKLIIVMLNTEDVLLNAVFDK